MNRLPRQTIHMKCHVSLPCKSLAMMPRQTIHMKCQALFHIPCKSLAMMPRQTIHMKCQTLLSLNIKTNQMSSAVAVIRALTVIGENKGSITRD